MAGVDGLCRRRPRMALYEPGERRRVSRRCLLRDRRRWDNLDQTLGGRHEWQSGSPAIALPAGYSGPCMCAINSLRFSDPRFSTSRTGAFVLDLYGTDGAPHDFIYYSTDAGAHWWPGPMLPQNCFTADFLTAAVGWTLDAKGNVILYTGDGGQHWSTLGTIPSSQGVMDFQFVNSAIGWALGSEPAGITLIKTSDGGRTWTTQLAP